MLPKTKETAQTKAAEPPRKAAAITALRKLSASKADMQSAVALLLSQDSALSVRPSHLDPHPCFLSGDGIYFQILDDLGRSLISSMDDLDIVCRALDAADPILSAIEIALSLNLEPTDILAETHTEDCVVLAVKMANIAVKIAMPADHAKTQLWLQRAGQIVPHAADTPCLLKLECTATHLSITEARDLSGGDMVLLANNLAMQIHAGPASLHGVFDVNSGIFTAAAQPVKLERSNQMSDNDVSDNDPTKDVSQFNVPISIQLPDQMISMEALAALKPGTNLPIGPLLQGLPVELTIAGKRLARGEIVQIGDIFAVLIDERGPISAQNSKDESIIERASSTPKVVEE